MILCAPNENQDKGNVGRKGLSHNTKVDSGAIWRTMVSNGLLTFETFLAISRNYPRGLKSHRWDEPQTTQTNSDFRPPKVGK